MENMSEKGRKMKLAIKKKPFWNILDGVTQSMLTSYLSCRQKAHWSYKRGLDTEKTSNAILFGTHFHEIADQVYRWKRKGKKVGNYTSLIESYMRQYKKDDMGKKMWSSDDITQHIINEGFLKSIIPKYFKKYEKKDANKKWLALEEEYDTHWRGVRIRGKYDRVARHKDGTVWLYDSKTKYRIDPDIQNRLGFDFQMFMYMVSWWVQKKEMPVGFVYDIVQRPNLRLKKTESVKQFITRVDKAVDDSYFYRITMSFTPEEIKQWAKKQFTPVIDEFHAWATGHLPTYKNVSSCEDRYGSCKFINLCGLEKKEGLIKKTKIFSELA